MGSWPIGEEVDVGGRSMRLLVLLVAGAMVLSACGGEGGETEGEGGGSGDIKCEGDALAAEELQLPEDFPIPAEAYLTSATEAGPSRLVEGYWEGDLESAYVKWKAALESAGYAILFDEIETEDSEISYSSPDESWTGQVALRSECEEEGRTFVHITNRPA
jgi:hypothetical protein